MQALALRLDIARLEHRAAHNQEGKIVARQDAHRFPNLPPRNRLPEEMSPDVQVVNEKPFLHITKVRHVMQDHADEKKRDRQNGRCGRLDIEA